MKISRIHIIIFSLFTLVFSGCTTGNDKEDCRREGGIWYKNNCVTESTPDKKLHELGLLEEEKTDTYVIDIEYPREALNYPEIHSHLKNIVNAIKSESEVSNAPDNKLTMSQPWLLEVDMKQVARAGDLASILIYSMTYSGGAHPGHYYRSLNFNTETQRIIDLDELFADPEYIYSLSGYVTPKLLEKKSEKTGMKVESDEWIERGTLPLPDNFEIFVFNEDEQKDEFNGIKFIFPPYTVGPYSDGEYEVVVPAKVFRDHLKKKYRNYFK